MRIGIDARMWGKGYGIGRYIEQLVLHLLTIDTSNTYVLFVRLEQKAVIEQEISQHASMDRIRLIVADVPWYSWKEQLVLPRIFNKTPVDLMHFPHWNVSFLYRKPFVVTIHDLTMFHYARPEATTRGKIVYFIKDKIHRRLITRVVHRARALLVTSEFTKQDIHNTLGVPLDNMVVTYQAPFFQANKNTKEQESLEHTEHTKLHVPDWQELFDRFGINGWFALYVGAAYPHKYLSGLLKAWKRFEERYGKSQCQLVLVGKQNAFYDPLLESDDMKACKQVVYTGFLSDEELATMYRQASLFVFPSLYEGFGLTPLDAMAHGVPVVSSDRSCMPEVLGDAALFVDPENSEQFVDALYVGFTDDDIRRELVANSKEVLRQYSWKKLAEETLMVYEKQGRSSGHKG